MPATIRSDDPTSIAQLVSKLEEAFEKGCGPLSDEVKRLVDASRRIDGGYECARGMLRARFGPASEARPAAPGWPRLLLSLMALLLTAITSGIAFIAWLVWTTAPKIDRALSSLSTPAELDFDIAPPAVVAGELLRNPPAVKVYDRLRGPVANVEVEFTISEPSDTAASAFIIHEVPNPLVFRKPDGSPPYDFQAGFDASAFKKTELDKLGKDIGGTLKLIQNTLSDGRASIPDLLVVPKVGTEFQITAKVVNSPFPLEKTITVKVLAGSTTLKFVPDPPVVAKDVPIGLKVQGSGKDKFGNAAAPLPGDAELTLSPVDEKGAPASDVTIASDDAAIVVKDLTAKARADSTGAADFGKLKVTKATKDKNYKLKAARVPDDARASASSGVSAAFKVTGIP